MTKQEVEEVFLAIKEMVDKIPSQVATLLEKFKTIEFNGESPENMKAIFELDCIAINFREGLGKFIHILRWGNYFYDPDGDDFTFTSGEQNLSVRLDC